MPRLFITAMVACYRFPPQILRPQDVSKAGPSVRHLRLFARVDALQCRLVIFDMLDLVTLAHVELARDSL